MSFYVRNKSVLFWVIIALCVVRRSVCPSGRSALRGKSILLLLSVVLLAEDRRARSPL